MTTTEAHKHEPYSHHGQTFRCRCGAVRAGQTAAGWQWQYDGMQGCAVCAAPTDETGDKPLCQYHRAIFR